MKTHVIVLAQGSQTRLPNLPLAKQMIQLPACGHTPILHRTLYQVRNIAGDPPDVTVVTWLPLMEQLQREPVRCPRRRVGDGPVTPDGFFFPRVDTLSSPGNSSLKGAGIYLETRYQGKAHPDRFVILLGDVIYSWACLRAIFMEREGWPSSIGFVGTSNISTSGGEIWGLTWCRRDEDEMMTALGRALEKHPKFKDYQPGQMRKWMWSLDPAFQNTTQYSAIDDYTMDIDIPAHLQLVAGASVSAAIDDESHGVVW